MIKISNRLKSLVKYISIDDEPIDVGCDHALLDIYLAQTETCNKIYVCDVNANALQNGKENIIKYDLSSKVIPILSYGIEKINELRVNTVIISGMGSKNIIDILSSPNLNQVYKLVLQANNNWQELRSFLASKNFKIYDEEVIEDGKKTYINIVAIAHDGLVSYTDTELSFGPILSKDVKNLNYFKKILESYQKIYYASKTDEAKNNLRNLEKIIEDLERL